MVAYEDGLRIALESIHSLGATHCPLEKSVGRIVAEDIRATAPLPEVDRSAMDGYALRSKTPSMPQRVAPFYSK